MTGEVGHPLGLIDTHVHFPSGNGEVERYRGLLGRLLLDGVTGLRDMAGDAQVPAYLSLEARLDAPARGRRARPYRQKLPITVNAASVGDMVGPDRSAGVLLERVPVRGGEPVAGAGTTRGNSQD